MKIKKTIILSAASFAGLSSLSSAAVMLDFENSMFASTLSTGNNSASGTSIRWNQIVTLGGTNIDLVGTIIAGTYQSNNLANNGINGKFGQLQVQRHTAFTMRFSLVETLTQLAFTDTFEFAVFDIDTGPGTGLAENIESIGLNATDGTSFSYTLSAASELAPAGGTLTNPTFTGSTVGIETDNPNDPNSLTLQQQNRTVLFQVVNGSYIDLDFGVTPGGTTGRNFIFAGTAGIDNGVTTGIPVPEPSSVILSFIGGLGLLLLRSRR